MADKIDIYAVKFFKKSRTNEVENRQKIKTVSLNSSFTGSKQEDCTLTKSTFEKN